MSFFNKLKTRLFKSSSKLEEGLDAIIEEGGEEVAADEAVEEGVVETAPEPVVEDEPAADPEPASEGVPEVTPEPDVVPEPVATSEPAAPKPGILARLTGRGGAAPVVKRVLDDYMLEQL
jgi:fused signal recognition particle receptor